jgi:hypothetical protein
MRQKGAGAIFLLLCIFALPGEAQRNARAAPILDVRDISQGCRSGRYDRTYLRVFGDGRVEWEAFDEHEKAFIVRQETLSNKKLNAIQWSIDTMKGLKDCYVGKGAENNIDDGYRFAITGRRGDKTYKTEIGFGLAVSGENYSGQHTKRQTWSFAGNITLDGSASLLRVCQAKPGAPQSRSSLPNALGFAMRRSQMARMLHLHVLRMQSEPSSPCS